MVGCTLEAIGTTLDELVFEVINLFCFSAIDQDLAAWMFPRQTA